MPRAALILTAGLALAVPGVVAASAGGSATGTPTTTVPVAVDPAAPVTTTTVAGAAVTTTVPATTVPATTVPRGGAASGSIAKPEPAEGWSFQRLATLTLLGIVALAAVGYAFGRVRSTPPVHPDL